MDISKISEKINNALTERFGEHNYVVRQCPWGEPEVEITPTGVGICDSIDAKGWYDVYALRMVNNTLDTKTICQLPHKLEDNAIRLMIEEVAMQRQRAVFDVIAQRMS